MIDIHKKISSVFFQSVPSLRLALLRICIGVFASYYITVRYGKFLSVNQTDLSLFQPVGLAHVFGPISQAIFQPILLVTIILSYVFIIGYKHKFIAPIYAVLLLLVLSYRNSWSMVYHTENVLVFHVLVLAFSASADSVSIDSIGSKKPKNHWKYSWPIALMCALTLATYFVAGIAKLLGPTGISWITGEVMRSQIAVDAIRKEVFGEGAPEIVFMLYSQTWLFLIMGIIALVIELGAPAAFFHKKIGYIWAALSFVMHWGILIIMGIKFRYCLTGVMFLIFFDIEKLYLFTKEYLKKITLSLRK